jgi:dienelactone hydrolase
MNPTTRRLLTSTLLVLASWSTPSWSASQADVLMRAPWSRGGERFQRQWMMLGPLPATASIEPPAAPPAAGGAIPDGPARWTPFTSWNNVVDLGEALGTFGPGPAAAYAHATVARERAGEAVLSVGNDGGIRIWANGALVHERPGPRSFAPDEDQIPVRLVQGENRLLFRLESAQAPWRFSFRVLETGGQPVRREEVSPAIVETAPGELAVRTHFAGAPGEPPVRVEVIGAGGRRMAEAEAPRGEVVRFSPAAWPDGAYELRCTTRTPWGRAFTKHLPWYKGDALAAARRLAEAAPRAGDDPRGDTLRMLAEMVLDRLGGSLDGARPQDAWKVHSPLLEAEELELSRAGGPGPVRPFGFVRIAYRDEVDGSPQFCRTYLPPDYDASRPAPLVVYLHGYNPPNPPYTRWWLVDQRHDATADRHGVIYLEPHGRGNTQYAGIGERDVLRCLAEARRLLAVDEERVYLLGESMGGHGVWRIASRHPQLFAAAAPVYGGWDWRLTPEAPPAAAERTELEAFRLEVQSSFSGAEALLNVPLFVHHGDRDLAVNVEHSRHAVRMLQRWGYDVRYEEHVGWAHENLDARDRIVEWMLGKRRVSAPRRVRLRAGDLLGADIHWVRVEAREAPFQLMEVDAEVTAPGVIRLDTRNVTAVALTPPASLGPASGPWRVVWNGQSYPLALRDGVARLSSSTKAGPLRKRAGLEGPLSEIVTTPFAVVMGTASADPLMRQRCREKAEAFVQLWRTWQRQPARLLRDDEITPDQEKRYSLLLVGGPDANLVTRRTAAKLPLQVEKDAITVDGRRLAVTDAVVQMIHPSPFHPDRYVVVVAATSADGMYFWKPALWNLVFGYAASAWDWSVQDGRRAIVSGGGLEEKGWVAAGMFDGQWRRDDRHTLLGDADLRARSPLRRAPRPAAARPAELEAFVGRYQLAPGFVVAVAQKDGRLILEMPSWPPIELLPESETEFGLSLTGAQVTFKRNAEGKVDGWLFFDGGREIPGPRVE